MLAVDKTFVINLDARMDRWDRMVMGCRDVGLTPTRWPAIPAARVESAFAIGQKAGMHKHLKCAAELATLLTHRDLLKHVQVLQIRRIAILEDDVVFHRDFHQLVRPDVMNHPWVYLGATQYHWDDVRFEPGFYWTARTNGAFAMVLTQPIIETMLEATADFEWPVDDCYRLRVQPLVPARVLWPNACAARVTDSDIRPPQDQGAVNRAVRWETQHYGWT